MKVTVIMDNQVPINAKLPFRAEHGQALLLATPDSLFLFDTGQSDLLLHNLSLVGVHPSDLDGIIISHGHYDHTGGLSTILTHAQKRLPVYIHADAFAPRFSVSDDHRRFIGIPVSQELLIQLGADFHFITAPLELRTGLWLSGPIPRTTSFEHFSPTFEIMNQANQPCQDHVIDDLSIYLATPTGLVILSGCAHAGIINTIRYGLAITNCSRLRGIIGGTHLGSAVPQQQTESLCQLKTFEPDFIAANHCTGFAMLSRLAQDFGDCFLAAVVSTELELL